MSYLSLIAKKIPIADQSALIDELLKQIFLLVSPMQIILFGSASRQEMSEASDLDVIVIVDKQQVKSAQKALAQLSLRLAWPVDVLVYDAETFVQRAALGGVCYIAETEGKILFTS